MRKLDDLINIYKSYSDEQLQEEIDAIFEIIYAILQTTESDSIETYPTTTVMLKFSISEIKKGNDYLC